jgi:hypothetical protein
MSANRMRLLARRDIFIAYKSALIVAPAVLGVYVLVSCVLAYLDKSFLFSKAAFAVVLTLGGWIISSFSFRELHEADGAARYLTLPASTAEKLAERVILLLIGWPVLVIFGMAAVSGISEAVDLLLFGRGIGFLDPFAGDAWYLAGLFACSDTVFIAGAVFFRKNAFIKTVLSLAAFGFLTAILASIGSFALFGSARGAREAAANLLLNGSFAPYQRAVHVAGRAFSYGILPAFWLVFSYVRLKETEIRDAL